MTDLDRIRKTKLKDLPYMEDDYLTRKQVKALIGIILIGLLVSLICYVGITYFVATADAIDEKALKALDAITK